MFQLKQNGFCHLKFLNIGGGLGINYRENEDVIPTPKDLVAVIAPLVRQTDCTILVEPGRSIVGNAGLPNT